MNSLSTVPLHSYELARYANPIICAMCDAENRFDGVNCFNCHAPLSLCASQNSRHAPPQLVTVLGPEGVGKSCYLGMLTDLLSRSTGELQMSARGAFSVSLQQQTMGALAHREFPPPTPTDPSGWLWVHCSVRRSKKKRPIDLVLPDVSGAVTLGEVETPRSTPAVRRLMTHGTAGLILVDAEELTRGEQGAEFSALKLLGDLLATVTGKRTKTWADRPLGIVFTKADRCDWALDSAEDFARRYTPSLWRQCHEQLHRTAFFATSIAAVATASDVYRQRWNIPLRIEPRGVLEPFVWLLEQLT